MKTSLIAVLGGMAPLTACSSTQQAAAPTPASGFLARDTVALFRPSDAGSRL